MKKRKWRVYGVSNAITAMAQEIESYDRSTDLERLGAKDLVLNKRKEKP